MQWMQREQRVEDFEQKPHYELRCQRKDSDSTHVYFSLYSAYFTVYVVPYKKSVNVKSGGRIHFSD